MFEQGDKRKFGFKTKTVRKSRLENKMGTSRENFNNKH